MDPFRYNVAASLGPFRIIDAGIRRGYGPIQVYRRCCFGGPIQDHRHCYSAVAMGPFSYIDIAASVGHSGLSTPVFGVAMSPFGYIDIAASVGPFRIIDAGIQRWLWAHSVISTLLLQWAHSELSTPVFGGGYGPIQVCRHCCFGGPIQDYRRRYSALAMGPFNYINIAASVGPLRIIDTGIR